MWSDELFDDSHWTGVALPDVSTARDRFYRGRFELPDPPGPVSLFFRCDDGCDVYVNGSLLGSYGPKGTCHQPGCVNLSDCFFTSFVPPVPVPLGLLASGTNVVAVHVTNGPNRLYFDMSIASPSSNRLCGNGRRDAGEACEPALTTRCGSGRICMAPGQPGECTCQLPPPRKRPVILIPGIYGSEIWGNQQYWPTSNNCTLSKLRPTDSGNSALAALGILRCTGTGHGCSSVPGCISKSDEFYGPLADILSALPDHELWVFPYDWRADIQKTGNILESSIDALRRYSGYDRVDIVAHSMGGLVAKEVLSRSRSPGGRYNEPKVRRMIFIGTPHFGAPKTSLALFGSLDDFFYYVAGLKPPVLGYVARNMPAAYQLLPSQPLLWKYPVLAVRSGIFSYVPVRTYQEFLVKMAGLRWQHTNCLGCGVCPVPDLCGDFWEFLNSRMVGWVSPHRRWDIWSPADSGLDAYTLYGNYPLWTEDTGYVDQTIRTVRIGVGGSQQAHFEEFEWGPGDKTVPVESGRADGITYFEQANHRFEFFADHTGLLLHAGVQECVAGILHDNRDYSGCVKSGLPLTVQRARAATPVGFLEVLLSGENASLRITDEAGNVTGQSGDGRQTDIPNSNYMDLGTAQIAVVAAGQSLNIVIDARESAALHLRLRTLVSNDPVREVHYDFALGAGDRATLSLTASLPAGPLAIDVKADGTVDDEVPATELPVANAGEHQIVRSATEVVLDGSRSAPHDAGQMTYRWTQDSGPLVVLSDPGSAAPRFTAPDVSEDTALAFSLQVTSGGVTSRPDDVSVLVRACGPERCNGVDDNCDGQIDENNPEGGGACDTGLAGNCRAGTQQCNTGQLECVPNESNCQPPDCTSDADCDDGIFCNGLEACLDGTCVPSETPPCSGLCDACDEDAGQCTTPAECSCPEHCNLDVNAPPLLAVEPAAGYDFGPVPVGSERTVSYAVQNQGSGILEASVTAAACPGFSVMPTTLTLSSSVEAPIVVTFAPPTAGDFRCELRITSNGGSQPLLLEGKGAPPCTGDCNGDPEVTVDEILTMVNIALGNGQVSDCRAGDANHDNQITVDEILTAVNNALNGCD